MNTHSPKTSRRPSRRALRRRQIARNVAWALSGVFVLGAFAGGILWRQSKVDRAAVQVVEKESSEEQQTEALRLFDEAVRARYEERMQGAMNAIAAARRADPQLRSVDVLVGEIALEQKDMETLQRAAEHASKRRGNEYSVSLLSALGAWMRRGESGADRTVRLAEQYLSDAADSEPSNAAVYFFLGELGRFLGDGLKAHRHLLSALHRQEPWRSAALLETKVQLATREAFDAGRPGTVESATTLSEVVLSLRAAVRPESDLEERVADLWRVITCLQAIDLFEDPVFAGCRNVIDVESLRRGLDAAVPHAGAGPSNFTR